VRTIDEVYEWDQTRSQGLLVDVEHATLGRLQLPGPPLRFFTASPDGETETTRREHLPPPVLDADGAAIRAEVADLGGDAELP
jgi:crotonobetainyl-CoA:carnitine CoA-transferase CaiB-like acyl-CoA transferase